MNRRSAIIAGLLGASILSGCADLMQRSTIAPEWFQAKAVEVKGEGYPNLRDIPESRGPAGSAAEWEGQAAALKNEGAKIEAAAAKSGDGETLPTDEELRAKAAQMRALIEEKPATAGAQPAPAP